jgi:hypothetical protein
MQEDNPILGQPERASGRLNVGGVRVKGDARRHADQKWNARSTDCGHWKDVSCRLQGLSPRRGL